ncbi:hypothetical protein COCOBI_pt-2170 (chloroplast) [Coccomyxa sp. Obi]|nr:hypothetical protein COCOBI_pt-2170 [Coccomyxa sp. Obi]
MEQEVSSGDIIDYVWCTRDYIIRSSTVPEVFVHAGYCPFCGQDVGKYSVQGEYVEAYYKAKEADPTLPDIDCDSELEEFQENFLRTWEAENEK